MLVRTNIFEELGGFDPAFDPYGPEDLDFGLRAKRAGYHGRYVPQALVFHETKPGHTFEGGQYTEKFASYRARHWMLFMRRHASPVQKLGFLLFGAPYRLARILIREGRSGNLAAIRGLLQAGFKQLFQMPFIRQKEIVDETETRADRAHWFENRNRV